jgi:NADPH:quinone reductase-like Zn-dependent oxidoreductase
MNAIVYHEYGSPDVLDLEDIDKPPVKDDEVLVRVHAASVNRLDWHLMRGSPYIARLQAGLRKPKDSVLGADVAGKVEAVGKHVTKFQPGDDVFGSLFGHGFGALAEYVSVSDDLLELKPANLSFEQAAAVPVAALTALQGLRDHGDRAGAQGADHRRVGRRGDVRRADRQVLRRRGDRRVQHEER